MNFFESTNVQLFIVLYLQKRINGKNIYTYLFDTTTNLMEVEIDNVLSE